MIAAAVVLALVATAWGYGYHRDELYFLAAGRHLAWGYPDQGPLVPLVARVMSAIAPGSLMVLRMPAALSAGCVVLLAGTSAGELGGCRRAQRLAAVVAAVAVIVLFTGHLLSTSTFDLLVWSAVSWLVVRAVRTGRDRLWLQVGGVLGVGLLNNPLPGFLATGLLAGVVISGPRRLLGSRYLWLGAGIAVFLWSPWLVWQAAHGWPQWTVASKLAAGGSQAYSGHNAYAWWGPSPEGAVAVIAVGVPDATLDRYFRGCATAGRVDNAAGIDNAERGRTISVCAGPRGSWAAVWPALSRLG